MTAVNKKQFGILIELQKTEQEIRAIQTALDRLPEEMVLLERHLEEHKMAVENEKCLRSVFRTGKQAHSCLGC